MKKLLAFILSMIFGFSFALSSVYALDDYFDDEPDLDIDDLPDFELDMPLFEIIDASYLPYEVEFYPTVNKSYTLTVLSSFPVTGEIKSYDGERVFEFSNDEETEFGYYFDCTLVFTKGTTYTFILNEPEDYTLDDFVLVVLVEEIELDPSDVEIYDELVVTTADFPMSIEFTPDETADYAVMSQSPVSLFGNITDEYGNEIVSFESETVYGQFDTLCAFAELEEGKTYYFNIDKYPYDFEEEFYIDICKLTGYLYDSFEMSIYENGEKYYVDAALIRSYHGSVIDLYVETLDGEVIAIDQYAFENRKIETLSLEEGFENIYNFAFLNCKNLYKVTLPDSLSVITYGAFLGCDSLKEISIGKDIYLIEPYALGYDENYQKIEGFVIKGYEGTAAQKYAEENGFEFVSLSGGGEVITEPTDEPATEEASEDITEPTEPTTEAVTDAQPDKDNAGSGEISTDEGDLKAQHPNKSDKTLQSVTQSKTQQPVGANKTNTSDANVLTGSKSKVVVIFIIVLVVLAAVVVIQIIRFKRNK